MNLNNIKLTGTWATSFYLGNFIGPTLAGIITEQFGFRSMTLFFLGSFCITFIMDVIELSFTIEKVKYEVLKEMEESD